LSLLLLLLFGGCSRLPRRLLSGARLGGVPRLARRGLLVGVGAVGGIATVIARVITIRRRLWQHPQKPPGLVPSQKKKVLYASRVWMHGSCIQHRVILRAGRSRCCRRHSHRDSSHNPRTPPPVGTCHTTQVPLKGEESLVPMGGRSTILHRPMGKALVYSTESFGVHDWRLLMMIAHLLRLLRGGDGLRDPIARTAPLRRHLGRQRRRGRGRLRCWLIGPSLWRQRGHERRGLRGDIHIHVVHRRERPGGS
jgi:hypothetical protein